MLPTFVPGNSVHLLMTLSQDNGATRVDPASVSLYIWLTGQSEGDPITPTHDGLGVFHYDYPIAIDATPGKYIARYVSSGGTPDATALSEYVFMISALNT